MRQFIIIIILGNSFQNENYFHHIARSIRGISQFRVNVRLLRFLKDLQSHSKQQ